MKPQPNTVTTAPSVLVLRAQHIDELSHALEQAMQHAAQPITHLKLTAALTELPAVLEKLAPQLQHLDLSDNFLSELPAWFAQCQQLQRLFLTNNRFTQLPPVLSHCHVLQMLSFKSNHLTAIPDHIIPAGIRWLILTDNQIQHLPSTMGQWQQLEKLALSGNRLTELPPSMAQCHQLSLVRLAVNRIQQWPDWLFSLPRLAYLAIGANPATYRQDARTITATPQDYSMLWPAARVQLGKVLGSGASGVIYQALDNDTQRDVAVKIFKGELTSDGDPAEELRHCLHAGQHPQLIPVLATLSTQTDVPTQRQATVQNQEAMQNQEATHREEAAQSKATAQSRAALPALVMALIPPNYRALGQPPSFATISRDTFAADSQWSATQLWHWSQQAAAVLQHLQQYQLAHGDFYAHNMLVNAQGHLLLGDFGAATGLSDLTLPQQTGFKRIEIRAFGYWLDDLLPYCHISSATCEQQQYQQLCQLRDQCLDLDPAARPSIEHIMALLQTFPAP